MGVAIVAGEGGLEGRGIGKRSGGGEGGGGGGGFDVLVVDLFIDRLTD